MAWAIDPKQKRKYMTLTDRRAPEEEQTEWLLRDPTERTQTVIADALSIQQEGRTVGARGFGSNKYETLKNCLVGVSDAKPLRRLDEESGEVVIVEWEEDPIKRQMRGNKGVARAQVSDKFLGRILPADKAEIALAIMRDPDLEEEHKALTEELAAEKKEREGLEAAGDDDEKPDLTEERSMHADAEKPEPSRAS